MGACFSLSVCMNDNAALCLLDVETGNSLPYELYICVILSLSRSSAPKWPKQINAALMLILRAQYTSKKVLFR